MLNPDQIRFLYCKTFWHATILFDFNFAFWSDTLFVCSGAKYLLVEVSNNGFENHRWRETKGKNIKTQSYI